MNRRSFFALLAGAAAAPAAALAAPKRWATGGWVRRAPVIVGERGPELFFIKDGKLYARDIQVDRIASGSIDMSELKSRIDAHSAAITLLQGLS